MDGYVKSQHLHALVFYDFRGYDVGDECLASVIDEMVESLKKSEYAGYEYPVKKVYLFMHALHLSVCDVIFLIERKPVCYLIIISFRTTVSWVEICRGLLYDCETADTSSEPQCEFVAEVQCPFQNASSFVHADDAGFPVACLVLDFRVSVKGPLIAVIMKNGVVGEQSEKGASESPCFLSLYPFVKQYGCNSIFHIFFLQI